MKLEAVHYRIVSEASTAEDLRALVEGDANLMSGVDCTGVAVFFHGRWATAGLAPAEGELDALARWLIGGGGPLDSSAGAWATDRLPEKYPAAEKFADVASGLLALRLSPGGRNLVLWFRCETLQTFTWAGNPNDLPLVHGPHGPRLTPRKSFELWKETVYRRSLPWRRVEIECVGRLRALLQDLVVNRIDEVLEANAKLRQSNEQLDAYATLVSHDLKEPLRGVQFHVAAMLREAKEQNRLLDADRERLETVERLAGRMQGLLGSILRYSRLGRTELDLEELEIEAVAREAIEMLGGARARAGCADRIRNVATAMPGGSDPAARDLREPHFERHKIQRQGGGPDRAGPPRGGRLRPAGPGVLCPRQRDRDRDRDVGARLSDFQTPSGRGKIRRGQRRRPGGGEKAGRATRRRRLV